TRSDRDWSSDVCSSDLSSPADVLGKTVSSLIRIAERTVIVCASKPSPMSACAVAYDGRETAQRALELVARFASVTHSTVHVIHEIGRASCRERVQSPGG